MRHRVRPVRPGTPSQTIGPFFHPALGWAVTPSAPLADDEWLVGGSVIDANGDGLSDALLEIWQPGLPRASGASVASGFQRACTDKTGRFAFTMRRARSTTPGDATPAALSTTGEVTVVHVTVFARGLLGALRTRLYVGAPIERLKARPELRDVPEERLATLMPSGVDSDRRALDWSVCLQGDAETVFFELV